MSLVEIGILIILQQMLSGCGKENLYTYVYEDEDRYALDPALDLARAYYDKGMYEESAILARHAYAQSPDSERVVEVLSYALMGQLGLAPIDVTQALIGKGDEKKEEPPAGDSETEAAAEEGSEDSDTTMSYLQTSMGIDDDLILSMGTLDQSDPELPLLLPKCAEALRLEVARIKLIDEATLILCPFIGAGAKSYSDYRHTCEVEREEGYSTSAKLYFVWGLAHLAESVIFQAAMQYNPSGESDGTSNLTRRAEKLQAMETTTPEEFEAALLYMEQMDQALAAIFPASSACVQSMMVGSFLDLKTAGAAFASVAGLPKKVLAPVEKAIAKLDAFNAGQEGSADIAQQSGSMREAATEKMKSALEAKVAEMEAGAVASPEQVEELCSLYSSIQGDTAPTTEADPEATCQD